MTTEQTYSESARGVIITRRRAIQEIHAHGLFWGDFVNDVYGTNEVPATFDAGDVMDWLGY